MTALSQMLQLNPYQAAERLSVDKIWTRLPAVDRPCACLIWAVLAPSPHNTQPWLWQVTPDAIELRADRARMLRVNDPQGRKLVISCGCALENLSMALRAFGIEHSVVELPDPDEPDLLARVALGARSKPRQPQGAAQLTAIRDRRTNRGPFSAQPLPTQLITSLVADADAFEVKFALVEDARRDQVRELVATADREELDDPDFRAELADWLRPRRTRRTDGMPVDLLGARGAAGVLASMALRRFNFGAREASRDCELVDQSPILVALGTDSDAAGAWLATGRALTRMTLGLGQSDLSHGYLGQPCEIPRLRQELSDLIDMPNPQLILRVGHSTFRPRATPRRPVADVLT